MTHCPPISSGGLSVFEQLYKTYAITKPFEGYAFTDNLWKHICGALYLSHIKLNLVSAVTNYQDVYLPMDGYFHWSLRYVCCGLQKIRHLTPRVRTPVPGRNIWHWG